MCDNAALEERRGYDEREQHAHHRHPRNAAELMRKAGRRRWEEEGTNSAAKAVLVSVEPKRNADGCEQLLMSKEGRAKLQ